MGGLAPVSAASLDELQVRNSWQAYERKDRISITTERGLKAKACVILKRAVCSTGV